MTINTNTPTAEVGAFDNFDSTIIPPFATRAQGLLSRGWFIFPLKPFAKTPLTAHGYKDASNDFGQIQEWNRIYPNANIGIATGASNLVVIDCDSAKGQKPSERWRLEGITDGMDVFATIASEQGQILPNTYTIKTPNGGWHFYFQNDRENVKSGAEVNGMWRVDVRANGGYIVGEGSYLPSGVYESGIIQEVIPCPNWIYQAISPKTKAVSINFQRQEFRNFSPNGSQYISKVILELKQARHGNRNSSLNASAYALGKLVTRFPDLHRVALKSLMDCALSIGLSEQEAIRTIMSGYKSGLKDGVANVR